MTSLTWLLIRDSAATLVQIGMVDDGNLTGFKFLHQVLRFTVFSCCTPNLQFLFSLAICDLDEFCRIFSR